MLKQIIFGLLFSFMLGIGAQAQSIAIVDVAEILSKSTEFTAAQQELDRLASKWRQDIAQEQDDIKSMYNKYQAEKVLLSDEMRKEREDAIMRKEEQVRELNRIKFGPEGELFRKRQQLVSPIQTKIYNAIQEYANGRGIDLVLDKSSAAGILFANDDLDKTEEVIRKLGLK